MSNRRIHRGFQLFALCLVAVAVAGAFASAWGSRASAASAVFAADKGRFTVQLDGHTVGHEDFDISPTGAGWTAKGTIELKAPDSGSAKVTGTLTLQPDALEEAAPCVDKDAGHYVTRDHHDNTR